jgi:tripartite-type tricarboxylate transporter receptor subunit TctC
LQWQNPAFSKLLSKNGEKTMKKIGRVFAIFCSLFIFAEVPIGMAADFPQKPIRMIVPYSTGGANDIIIRTFQPAFEKVLGQRILVENIGAGTTKVGTMELMKAKPDGYTLLLSTTEAWVGYYYSGTYDYKVWEKMEPIGTVVSEAYGFIEVRAESPFKTWADLVKAAKENPGKLTCGLSGAGGIGELIMAELTQASGIKVRYVPFAGSGPSKVAVLGGHVDFRNCQPSNAIDMIRAGQTRGLGVSTDKRMEIFPDIPTFKELGGPTISQNRAIWGPPKLPSNLIKTLTKMIEDASKDPTFRKIAQNQFVSNVNYQPPEIMKANLEKFDKEFGPKLAEMYK